MVPRIHYQQDLRARKTILSVTVVLYIFDFFSFDIAKALLYELQDPETKVKRVRSYDFGTLQNLLSVEVVLCVFLELIFKYCTAVLHRGG